MSVGLRRSCFDTEGLRQTCFDSPRPSSEELRRSSEPLLLLVRTLRTSGTPGVEAKASEPYISNDCEKGVPGGLFTSK